MVLVSFSSNAKVCSLTKCSVFKHRLSENIFPIKKILPYSSSCTKPSHSQFDSLCKILKIHGNCSIIIFNVGASLVPVLKNLPANARDMGPVSDLGSICCRATKPQLLRLCRRVHASRQEKPPQWETHTPHLRSSPNSLQLEKSARNSEYPAQPKINSK